MPSSKTPGEKQSRQLHRFVAPIMVLPILVTLITGSIYEMFDLAGQGDRVKWLLALHKGHFGIIRLDAIYPFFNALGLLFLVITGISMWLSLRRSSKQRTT